MIHVPVNAAYQRPLVTVHLFELSSVESTDSALRTSCLAFIQFPSASDQLDPQSSRSYLTGAGLLLTISPLRSFSSQLLFDEAVVFETVIATEVTTVS